MRKILITYLPASLLFTLLAMLLLTCGGGGGDGGGGTPPATLTGLSINGPASMSEYGAATYTATASWDDNTTSTVTPDWSVNFRLFLQMASISAGGVLSCAGIDADQVVTITATYSSGDVDETDTMDVTVTDIATIPFTTEMVSGQSFFEENSPAAAVYESTLSILNADFSFDQYSYEGPPPPDTPTGTSDYVTGTWSIDTYGNLVVNISGQGTVTVGLISDSSTEIQAVVADGTEPPPIVTLEKIVPVDPAKVPGTYTANDGETWVFNIDGTGTITIFGGGNFTWSVDTGILKVVDLTFQGYHPQLYARASSQSDATSYTLLNAAFVELTPTDGFYKYYGGYEMTRQ